MDIVKTLRALADEWHEMCGDIHVPLTHAADEIERLRKRVAELEQEADNADYERRDGRDF